MSSDSEAKDGIKMYNFSFAAQKQKKPFLAFRKKKVPVQEETETEKHKKFLRELKTVQIQFEERKKKGIVKMRDTPSIQDNTIQRRKKRASDRARRSLAMSLR